jgi:ribonuclease R
VSKKADPYAKRESKKYTNPIVSREYILSILDKSIGPLTLKQIAKKTDIKTDQDREALRRRLIAMERDGQIHSNRKQAYARVDKMDLIRGKVQGHRDGYGFLIPSDGSEDVYLSSRQMRRVFNGDEVLVRLSSTGIRGRLDGVITEVLSHNTHQLVGRYHHEQGIGFVRPENVRQAHDVLIPHELTLQAKSNQFVMVEITQQPSKNHLPVGRIIEILGDHLAPGMEIDVAIRSHDIPHEWPQAVLEQADQLPLEVAEADKKHRVDLRDCPFVTIDGEDARDFDDAVYCEAKKSGGWRLFVAIADVSHYVTLHTALDQEAENRSTSVYFPDFVVPMLPEALSNGLCSLNPKVDRLAMVCEMTISASGRISGYLFYEALIHSHARLTYTQVGQVLSERFENAPGQGFQEEIKSLLPHLDELYILYKTLRKIREARGAIDFETTETRILFDEERKIERIIPVERNDAHKLIEECMLAANVCAARFLEKHDLVGLFRVHDGPREQKLENLKLFLGELGLSLRAKQQPEPAHYQSLLKKIANRPDAKIIQTVMLRSLAQAMYQPDNQGHFGLAYPAYTHFTSPIRRYPDLLVHRAIRHVILSRQTSSNVRRVKGSTLIPKKQIYPYLLEDMLALGEHTSMAERRADEATRDVVSWLKCEYLQDHVGDVYQGVVTGVTNFGLFVELLDLYVEGLVHITSLPSDYYHFEEAHHRLVGERTRRTFCLGDELTVKVSSVTLDERKVDFELAGDDAGKPVKKESVRDKLRRGDFENLDKSSAKSKKGQKKAQSGKKALSKSNSKASKGKQPKNKNSNSKKATKKKKR